MNSFEPEFAVPVLPNAAEVPGYASREIYTEQEVPLPDQSGILKMNDFQRKIRDLEL